MTMFSPSNLVRALVGTIESHPLPYISQLTKNSSYLVSTFRRTRPPNAKKSTLCSRTRFAKSLDFSGGMNILAASERIVYGRCRNGRTYDDGFGGQKISGHHTRFIRVTDGTPFASRKPKHIYVRPCVHRPILHHHYNVRTAPDNYRPTSTPTRTEPSPDHASPQQS
jgi:hypothetical protein